MIAAKMKTPFDAVVAELSLVEKYRSLAHLSHHNTPMPSVDTLAEIVEMLRQVLFPGYYGESDLTQQNLKYYIGAKLDRAYALLAEEIKRGQCFSCDIGDETECRHCETTSREKATRFIERLPEVRRLLATDVEAAYEGDPAATSHGETIYCYPSIYAMTNFRIAHELHELEVPLIPRIITEIAHSKTGIDLHPGAQIGEKFFMDHGTGIVVGGTSVIGRGVKIYQGVTLGAKSFPLDKDGNPIKGVPRHPIVEDNVIIYSNATILGRITIGHDSVIGGNTWTMQDVPPNTKVLNK
ncbi:MAG TPA: serine acetyltransferase [bacterium]|nr:serine acetyltransferase [bacterium]